MGTKIQTRIRPKKGGHRYIVTDSRTTTEELNKKSQINHDNLCTCQFYPLKVRARSFFSEGKPSRELLGGITSPPDNWLLKHTHLWT